MFISADQLLAHGIGDYILQSSWMANEKTKSHFPALVHAVTYTLPFLFFRPSWLAAFVICSTHFVIDRWRLARFVIWVKNFIGPAKFEPSWILHFPFNQSWPECKATGYTPDTPIWLAVWLLIISDNLMHITINGLALRWL
jgi:hypothetical protein